MIVRPDGSFSVATTDGWVLVFLRRSTRIGRKRTAQGGYLIVLSPIAELFILLNQTGKEMVSVVLQSKSER